MVPAGYMKQPESGNMKPWYQSISVSVEMSDSAQSVVTQEFLVDEWHDCTVVWGNMGLGPARFRI